uniref:Uncharacterized protein n=1 Tax=Arundo donax TaxID=35708 RepID=A0A0A9BX85_ARUDO
MKLCTSFCTDGSILQRTWFLLSKSKH